MKREKHPQETLILSHRFLVPLVVQMHFSRATDRDDLTGQGYYALCLAASRYDPARGASFRTYATNFIRCRLIDYLRDQDWVPRAVREEPGAEIVEIVSLWEETTRRVAESRADTNTLPQEFAESDDERTRLWRNVARLPDREAETLWLRYAEDWTYVRIGKRFGVSGGRAQQMEWKGLERLRQKLEAA